MKKIYTEYVLNGKFHIRFFDTWDEYHAATFSPDCEILVVKEL